MWITWKVIVHETCFCEKIQADFTVSSVSHEYFNFVPMLESRNVDHVKSDCSWDMFLWKNSGGRHTFMSFSKIFRLCNHARITKCGSRERKLTWDMFLWKNSGGLHTFMSFSKIFQLCNHARITKCGSREK